MRRKYFKLSALLVAFFVVSFGVTPLFANNDVQPVGIKFQGTTVKHRAVFELNFSNFSRVFRVAYQRMSDLVPFSPPAPPVFEPIDDNYSQPIFWLGKPSQNDDPNEGGDPGIIDDGSPM